MPSRRMTLPEMVQLYWETADHSPDVLAALYVNFHQFLRIEFLIFYDRLCSAILVANATRQSVDAKKQELHQTMQDGSQRFPGWEGESDMMLEEQIAIVDDAEKISIGATMLTAVAALESLLKDLLPDGLPSRAGLQQLVREYLIRHDATPQETEDITSMVSKVAKRRNVFAHALTGSYWETEEAEIRFDFNTMQDTLMTVGEIAVALDLVQYEESQRE